VTYRINVEYKDIPEMPGYRAGNDGSVWSCKRRAGNPRWVIDPANWRELKPRFSKTDGRACFSISVNGKAKPILRSVLVLSAFAGKRPEGMLACHNDGNPTNDRAGNLRWDTPKGNLADMLKHKTKLYGERSPRAKLSNSDVKSMRQMWQEGNHTLRQLASIFGLSHNYVHSVVAGRERVKDDWLNVERE
jgi:hypothetical protein